MVDYDEVLAPREGAPAEADRLRRLGLPAHGRGRPLPRDRRRGRRATCSATWPTSPGLVAAGLHPNPVPHCDFVTSTTHKTLAGPRSGFVLCREEHAQALDRAVFPGMQGGPMEHVIAAKATCFRIAGDRAFREYQAQVRANADALADELADGRARRLTGGTDTHLLQVDLRALRVDGQGRRGAPRRGEHHRQPQHRAVRRAAADGRLGRAHRARRRARCAASTRRTSARSGGIIVARARRTDADVDGLRRAADALCERRPLYPGFRGCTTYEA